MGYLTLEGIQKMNKWRKESVKNRIADANNTFKKENSGLFVELSEKNIVTIFISRGDWKHDHLYADCVMRNYAFRKVDEHVTEENGDDCYSSIHYYKPLKK